MLIEIVIALLCGFILGIIAGLIPGLHINLISSLIIVLSPALLSFFSPFALILFIITMSITTIFLDFIPSTYLGAPEEETALSILPSHELLMKGKANTAIYLSSLGSFIGIILSLILIPLFYILLEKTYPFFEKMMFFLLIWIAIFLIVGNKNIKLVIFIALLAGFLGIASLNLNITQPLLPLLTGLFGTSGIIFSIKQKTKIPKQQEEIEKPKIHEVIKPSLVSLLVSPLCSFLPGLGSSQATTISSKLFGDLDRKQFLITNGAINMIISILSIITLLIIGKSRTGSAAAISQISSISQKELIIILIGIFFIGIASFFTALKISKILSRKISNLNYQKISWTLLILLSLAVLLVSGLLGFLVLIVSTFLGLTSQYYGLNKNTLMFCLLIPTILYYIPL
jgi:putative membrane protein